VGDLPTTSWRWRPPAPMAFLLPVDCAWLRTAYEHEYEPFVDSMAELGRPVGYQFLTKLFDAAVPVPPLSRSMQERYLSDLLHTTVSRLRGERVVSGGPKTDETERLNVLRSVVRSERNQQAGFAKRQDALSLTREVAVADSGERLRVVEQRAAALASSDRDQVLAAVAERRFDPAVRVGAEHHFLEAYGSLLERNPRAVKRVLNDFGIRQVVRSIFPSGRAGGR